MNFKKLNEKLNESIDFNQREPFFTYLQEHLFSFLFETNNFQEDEHLYSCFYFPMAHYSNNSQHIYDNKLSVIDIFYSLTNTYKKNAAKDEIKEFYYFLISFINKTRLGLINKTIDLEKDENIVEMLKCLYDLEDKSIDIICYINELSETLKYNLNVNKIIPIYVKYENQIINNLNTYKYEELFILKNKINIFCENEPKIIIEDLKEIFKSNICFYSFIFNINECEKLSAEDKVERFIAKVFEIEKLSFNNYVSEIAKKIIEAKDDNVTNEHKAKILKTLEKLNETNNEVEILKNIENKINSEIQERDNAYIKQILILADDTPLIEKEKILIDFLDNGYEKTSYNTIKRNKFSQYNKEDLIKRSAKKLMRSKTVLNQICAGEHLFEKISKNINGELKADYTFLVAAQIKSVERYIKELMINRISGVQIIESNGYYVIPNKNFILDDNADQTITNNDRKFINSTLGNLDYMLNQCLRERNPNLFESKYIQNINQSIFYKNHGTAFYNNFVSVVRNGHFHLDNIPTISEASKIRAEVGFWLLCVADELKEMEN